MAMFFKAHQIEKNRELTAALSGYRSALQTRGGDVYDRRIKQAARRAETAHGNREPSSIYLWH